MTRAALPASVTTITPGYAWELVLDVQFAGERPDDWPDWGIRMHIWHDTAALRLTLEQGAGISIEPVELAQGLTAPVPVIRLTAAQTEALRPSGLVHYVIDLTAPGGEPEDYLAGTITRIYAPPASMLGGAP